MNEMEEHETHHHLWSMSSSQRSTEDDNDDHNDEEDDDKTLTMFREDLGGEKENARPEESRYEQIPDTVAALQDSHKALLSQLRETQEMLEVVLEDNDKLRRQLCASNSALQGSQRMHEETNHNCIYSNDVSTQDNDKEERKYNSALKETTNAISAIAKIHKQEAESTRLQRDTLKQVLQSQDLENIVSI